MAEGRMSTQEGTREYHSLRGEMADSCHTRMLDSSCARVIRCSPVEHMMSLTRLKKQMCVSCVSSGAMQALRKGRKWFGYNLFTVSEF